MATAAKSKKTTAAASKKQTTPSTEFKVHAPEAQEIKLVGDFNNWDGSGHRLRRFKDGTWKKVVKLKPGRYQYRFLVDGNWWTDPENPNRQPNEFGSENSVIEIG